MKKKSLPRNRFVYAMLLRSGGGIHKDKRSGRGGASNKKQKYLREL
jgi:hypothetical protein